MTELMSSGVELMLIGMGIVYFFLALLVVAINIMTSLVRRFFPDEQPVTPLAKPGLDANTVAAITAAIHQHRSKNKKV
ncbi:MAG: OadG family protein [Gammaproteobacteria bacterium]